MEGIGHRRPRQSNLTSGRKGDPGQERKPGNQTQPPSSKEQEEEKPGLESEALVHMICRLGPHPPFWMKPTRQAQGQRGGNWSPDCLSRCCEGNGDNRVWGVC